MKLPQGWKEVELGEIFNFEKKSNIKAGENKKKGKYKLFTSSDIQSKFIDKAVFDGEYLIFSTGGSAGVHYCNEKFSTSTDCFVVRVDNKLISKYVYYYLFANIQVLEAGFKGAGLKHISKEYIKKIKIIFPEKKEIQQKIVSILEKCEKAKEMRKEADELTKDFLKSVFIEMFGDPSNNTKKWPKKPLRDFGEIITGNTPTREIKEYYGSYIDWIKSDNLNTPYTFLTRSEEMLSQKGAKVGRLVPKGSILVTCIAGSLSCIGNAAIADREVAFNQQINAIIPNKSVDSLYFYFLIINSKKIIQDSSTQSMKGMVNKSVFGSIFLPLPPLPLQQKFASIVKEVEIMKEHQKLSKDHLDNLFNALMQKAFKGELI